VSWYYNTESGALTSADAVQGFLQDFQSTLGLAAGWHKLNIAANATEAQAAAEAKKEFPAGTAPTTSVVTAGENALSQETTGSATTFSSVQNALSSFYGAVTDGKRWRSLGWILLGVLLIFMGLVQLAGGIGKLSPAGMARRVISALWPPR
jgi:hypothetical protein